MDQKSSKPSSMKFPRILGLTGFKPSDTYLGLESIMYGRLGTCDNGFTIALLPGWADQGQRMACLINGRPINGASPTSPMPGP